MLQFIIQYWVQFLLGIIATGMTGAFGWIFRLYKKNKKAEQSKDENKFLNKVEKLIDQKVNNLKQKVVIEEDKLIERDNDFEKRLDTAQNSLNIITAALLSFFGDKFKRNCNKLLEKDTITLADYEWISHDHDIYNSMGGNHDGDDLFDLVREKYKKQL